MKDERSRVIRYLQSKDCRSIFVGIQTKPKNAGWVIASAVKSPLGLMTVRAAEFC